MMTGKLSEPLVSLICLNDSCLATFMRNAPTEWGLRKLEITSLARYENTLLKEIHDCENDCGSLFFCLLHGLLTMGYKHY